MHAMASSTISIYRGSKIASQIFNQFLYQKRRRYNNCHPALSLRQNNCIISSISQPLASSPFSTSTSPVFHPWRQAAGDITSPLSSSSSSSTQRTPAKYSVSKINAHGKLEYASLTLSEILEDSPSIHTRDLFALHLTSQRDIESGGVFQRRAALEGGSEGGGESRVMEKSKSPSLFSRRSSILSRRAGSVILPRGEEIVMSLGTVRAVIGKDSAMLLDSHRPSIKVLAEELAETFKYKMKEAMEHSTGHNLCVDEQYNVKATYIHEPFELVFIEEILRDACDTFNRRIRLYEPIVDSLLDRVSNEVFSESGVHRLVPIKDSLQEFEITVKQGLHCLEHLLDNDEDMLGLLLTERATARKKGENLQHKKHDSVELLLEEYARQLSGILQEIHYLLQRVQSKQELVALSLDGYRNRMIRMNLYLSMAAIGFAASTTVAGYFGMNLVSGLEDSPVAFNYVVMSTSMAGVGIFAGCASYISGSRMRKRTLERVEEIETISGALSEMSALDFAAKAMVESETPLTRENFKQKLLEYKSYQNGNQIKDNEVDLLFNVLDNSKDGTIYTEDFRSIETFSKKKQTGE